MYLDDGIVAVTASGWVRDTRAKAGWVYVMKLSLLGHLPIGCHGQDLKFGCILGS